MTTQRTRPIGSPPDGPERLAAALERIAAARRALTQQIATAHALSALQVEIVRYVAATPETRSTALATELGVSLPTVSDALAALRRKGVVEQRPGSDGRTRIVSLTVPGRRLAQQVEAELAPFRRAVAHAGDAGLTAALAVIGGLWREGLLSVDRSCATCVHHLEQPAPNGRCALLGLDLTAQTLRVDCPEHSAA